MFTQRRRKLGLTLALSAALLQTIPAIGGQQAVAAASSSTGVLPGTPYKADGSYDNKVPHIMINQVYGAGLKDTAEAFSTHGFIELYNPLDVDVNLTGWSLQYADRGTDAQTGPTNDWESLNLTGTIKAHSSFLILGKATGSSARLDLNGKADQSWDRYMNNKGMKVALVSNTTKLTAINPFNIDAAGTKAAGYVDMVGTGSNDNGSTIDGYESEYPSGKVEYGGTSKKMALRRNVDNSNNIIDTDNNKLNFYQVDYSNGATHLAEVGPRNGAAGPWGITVEPLAVKTATLPYATAGVPYSAAVESSGGTKPYSYAASGLPQGLGIDPLTGIIAGTPLAAGSSNVTVTVTDSVYSPQTVTSAVYTPQPQTASRTLTLNTNPSAYVDQFTVTKIGHYSVGVTDEDGGVAEIVKFNKDNGKFYLVNGSANPPTLEIVSLTSGTMTLDTAVQVQTLVETDGFQYGDLTSVDINTANKRVYVSVQEKDPMKAGRILELDYDGNLKAIYTAGVQPDMIKSTPDGRYVLTANEGEPRAGADPKGSVTILDTATGTTVNAEFNDPAIIDDRVNIRGASDPATGQITSKGTKADALYDLEPEYITLSADAKTAYVTLQENNAVAALDLTAKKFTSVKGLGLKDYNVPRNALDLVKDGNIKLENVPFYGLYMPDGIASYTANDGATYLVTANEGDATEWPGRTNVTKISALKGGLDPNSAAAQFLNGKTAYDGVEVMSGLGNDGIYMYGGRSMSIWRADTMEQSYDSGSDFERITAERLPNSFNASHAKTAKDDRSSKKGPEPEDVKIGQVGARTLAFVGLERVGGVMMYDVTDPAHAQFVNYTNSRVFAPKDNLNTETGPEGIEYIPASISPTGKPLLLVAFEVGGTVAVYQLNVSQVMLDHSTMALTSGGATGQLQATATAADGTAAAVTWSSSNPSVASVNEHGAVTPHASGTAVISAVTADRYGMASSTVTVQSQSSPGTSTGPTGSTGGSAEQGSKPEDTKGTAGDSVSSGTDNGVAYASISLTLMGGESAVSEELAGKAIAAIGQASGNERRLELHIDITGSGTVRLSKEAVARLAEAKLDEVTLQTNGGSIVIGAKAWSKLLAKAASGQGDISIQVTNLDGTGVLQGRQVVHFQVRAGGQELVRLEGGVRIRLPYAPAPGENPNAIVPYAVKANGTAELVVRGSYDLENNELQVVTDSLLTGFAAGYHAASFQDTQGSFASDAITYLAARNVIGGVGGGRVAPASNVTRGDLVVMLSRIAGVQPGAYTESRYADVDVNLYDAQAIEWASDLGIAGGTGADQFSPASEITREQLVTMLVRFAEQFGLELPRTAEPVVFADAASISGYAADAVAAAQQAGLASGRPAAGGKGVLFAPQAPATRAETAKVLALMMEMLVNQ
ncbi:choice-of-anchor I family protein [Paenibacillus kobensis]|uniref:choice-of-anchor I family protein n=1 Tax=Paenibacillus kobensis TaxID=59841 RepID=UPI000FD8B01E|nr:choice-of-anchor I family protein [Paenibacillus kobensis]